MEAKQTAAADTKPNSDGANWPPNSAELERLILILQAQPQFADPHQRLSFLQGVFISSPRQQDILNLINVAGIPRSVAVQVVNRLIQFGQDKPGRQTLGLLISALLSGYGDHPDADFLRGLLDRYPMGVAVAAEPSQPTFSPSMAIPTAERFLESADRNWLATTIGHLSRFQDLPGRRNLLIESRVPDPWIGEISLDRGGTVEVARTVVNDLERRGALPHNRDKHALGGLLEALLESLGFADAVRAVAFIFRYRLICNPQELNGLSQRFGVPLPPIETDVYAEDKLPAVAMPISLRREAVREKLEALYANGRENWLDVGFLSGGARAAQAVCRLEWQKQGQGTGFLVAPDLILTNYHVLYPPEYTGTVTTRLRACEVRFGAYRLPDGGISAGNRVTKLHPEALVAASETDQLDYALLRLREPVEDGARIVSALFSEDEIYEEQYANIIQHPLGKEMKVALRHNQVVALRPQRVYYLSDTLNGSSGAPVFDDEWRVIALHRAAGLRDEQGQVIVEANEGVPILDILREIRPHLTGGK